jgi:hypothetical protein
MCFVAKFIAYELIRCDHYRYLQEGPHSATEEWLSGQCNNHIKNCGSLSVQMCIPVHMCTRNVTINEWFDSVQCSKSELYIEGMPSLVHVK